MTNFVGFELSTSNDYLANLLEDALDSAVSSEPMEVNSVEVILHRVGEAEIKPEGKTINIYLPLKINLKRAAGLFTVEGSGAINLHLAINYDISKDLRLRTKTDLVTHEWLEKPILEIGALNIPVETLVNMVLKHHESLITAKIDSQLKDFSNLKELISIGMIKAKDKLNGLDLKGNKIFFEIEEIGLKQPDVENGLINLNGYIKPEIGINTAIEMHYKDVNLRWLEEDQATDANLVIPVKLSYEVIEEQIKTQLQGLEVGGKYFDIRSVDIEGGNKLNVRMVIDEPIKAEVFVTGDPIYNEIEGELIMSDINVKVNPSNFIYKLTAPLVNRFVEGKMEEFFPLDISNKLSRAIQENLPQRIPIENGEILIKQEGVEITELQFGQNSLEGKGVIKNLNVEVLVK